MRLPTMNRVGVEVDLRAPHALDLDVGRVQKPHFAAQKPHRAAQKPHFGVERGQPLVRPGVALCHPSKRGEGFMRESSAPRSRRPSSEAADRTLSAAPP
ncbi:hypothetical protein [Sorangium sp. So ce204]|uniref:hypothetical protein n=1 Tax=Sorangium sp. So ce204 TaxID=3133288 RepID=UPI003F61A0AF